MGVSEVVGERVSDVSSVVMSSGKQTHIDAFVKKADKAVDKVYYSNAFTSFRLYIQATKGNFDKLDEYIENKSKAEFFCRVNDEKNAATHAKIAEDLKWKITSTNRYKSKILKFFERIDRIIEKTILEEKNTGVTIQ